MGARTYPLHNGPVIGRDGVEGAFVATGDTPNKLFVRKDNYSASAAPTATDDSAAGYQVSSIWIDTTNDTVYVCVDDTATAAVWNKLFGSVVTANYFPLSDGDGYVDGPLSMSGGVLVSTASLDLGGAGSGNTLEVNGSIRLYGTNRYIYGSNSIYIAPASGNAAIYDGSTTMTLDVYAGASLAVRIRSSGTSYFNGGSLVVGGTTASAKLHAIATTEQLRLGYDASNYLSATVSSAGAVTFNAVGASAGFTFADPIYIVEQAAASADVAGRGQLWVKSTTPNELWFTNDAGTDFQLGLGGGTVQGTDHTYDIRATNEGTTAGDTRGTYSVDLSTSRIASTQVASGTGSVIGGGFRNTAAGSSSTVSGGHTNNISSASTYAAIAGGSSNTIASIGSGIVCGGTNTINANYGFIGAGLTNTIDGSGAAAYAVICGGNNNTVSATNGTVVGGSTNTAAGNYSVVSGYNAYADKHGQYSHASGALGGAGSSQVSTLIARRYTTDATPSELFLDGSSARCTIGTNRSWYFTVKVIARRYTVTGESAAYKFEGVLDNDAGTTSLGSAVTKTVIHEDNASWDCDVTADDTNDALVITVTGEASKVIRWVAEIRLVEVVG